VQLATGVGVVGPFMAQVVAVQAFARLAATGVQLPSKTPAGPLVTAAGQLIVNQLLPALPIWAAQEPGAAGTVSVCWLQKVAVLPLPGPAFTGVQVPTFVSGESTVLQLVMTQLVVASPPGVHEATCVGPVTAVLQVTTVGPVGLATQDDTGTLLRTVGVQVVTTPALLVPATQSIARTCEVVGGELCWHWRSRKLLRAFGDCATQLVAEDQFV
jgi:hypothetical protein